jgi:hypothetical protein
VFPRTHSDSFSKSTGFIENADAGLEVDVRTDAAALSAASLEPDLEGTCCDVYLCCFTCWYSSHSDAPYLFRIINTVLNGSHGVYASMKATRAQSLECMSRSHCKFPLKGCDAHHQMQLPTINLCTRVCGGRLSHCRPDGCTPSEQYAAAFAYFQSAKRLHRPAFSDCALFLFLLFFSAR